MGKIAEKLNHYFAHEEHDTHHGLDTLIKIYEECHHRLEESFIISKEKVLNTFDKIRNNY